MAKQLNRKNALFAMFTFVLALVLAACGGNAASGGGSGSAGGAADTEKGEGVMTFTEFSAAKVDDPVVIEAYVQGKQSWWENQATIYAQDADGAYFIYNAQCSEGDYAKLVDGEKIKVTGY